MNTTAMSAAKQRSFEEALALADAAFSQI